MKKPSLYLALFAAMTLIACKQKEEVRTETIETNTVETVRDDPADTVMVKAVEEAPDGTAVKIDGDGIKVDTKNGDKSVDVNVDVKK